MKPRVLIVEDNASMLKMLGITLRGAQYEVMEAEDGEKGIALLGQHHFDAVLTDLKLPGKGGISVLEAAMKRDPLLTVIIMTAYGSIEMAVSAMKEGAYDFVTKPFDTDQLLLRLQRGIQRHRLINENLLLKDELRNQTGTVQILGRSHAFLTVLEQVQKVGPSNATVLILGESGTGKELIARAIHSVSKRAEYPFVAINCAAIPSELLENELFGHERGAYTGADSQKRGKFELADHGTLFLDEIGDLDPALQAKLLRVIQEREFERIGSTRTIHVDVRLLAASNRNLQRMVKEKKFREDLYYRLSVFPIRIPPLRERLEDIELLAEHFLRRYARELNRGSLSLAPDTLKRLEKHPWPGNVRELQNVIERATILSMTKEIQPGDLGLLLGEDQLLEELQEISLSGSLHEAVERSRAMVEKHKIRQALDKANGNKAEAARILQVNYKTLLMKIREYRLVD